VSEPADLNHLPRLPPTLFTMSRNNKNKSKTQETMATMILEAELALARARYEEQGFKTLAAGNSQVQMKRPEAATGRKAKLEPMEKFVQKHILTSTVEKEAMARVAYALSDDLNPLRKKEVAAAMTSLYKNKEQMGALKVLVVRKSAGREVYVARNSVNALADAKMKSWEEKADWDAIEEENMS
jgi:hypothetical protein